MTVAKITSDHQKLLWVPEGRDVGAIVKLVDPIPYEGPVSDAVWTLYADRDPDNPPELPIRPVHLYNAFLEDKLHDWNINVISGVRYFRYYSRVTEGGHWMLLIFKEEVTDGNFECDRAPATGID